MTPFRTSRWLVAILLAVIWTACAPRHAPSADLYYGDDGGYAEAEADYEVAMQRAIAPSAAPAAAPKRGRLGGASAAASAPPAPPPPAPAEASDAEEVDSAAEPDRGPRMVHYDGTARLRVAKVRDAQDAITAIAAAAGGLVENQYRDAITIRVPVARFDATFAEVLEVGDVLDKRITATDVTDRFVATELRLQTAVTTRERLVELLAQAEDEKDKLFLIREIQRLTEEIDRLEGQSRALSSLASMSRITAALVPRAAVAWRGSGDEAAEMQWLRALSPFDMDVARSGRKLTLAVPEGLVNLEERGHWVAESADGARVWSGVLRNDPRGDAAFWLAALAERLGPEFAAAEQGRVGDLSTLRLVSRDDDPYVWVIGIRVVGERLHLVEQFYPSLAHEERHGSQVRAALGGQGGGDA